MTVDFTTWLCAADAVLSDDDSTEAAVDAVLEAGLQIDLRTIDAGFDRTALQRVVAALTVRRHAVGAELTVVGEQRAELRRTHRGVAGYASSDLSA